MYNFSTIIRDKEIKFRKWRVKDKNRLLDIIENQLDPNLIVDSMVYECIEDREIALSPEEYKYMLIQIRKESISKYIDYEFVCENCKNEYSFRADLDEIAKPSFKEYGILKSNNTSFKMGHIRNRNFYLDALNDTDDNKLKKMIDFMFHVQELNGSDAFTFDTLFDFVDNMEIDVAEDIFKQWEDMKFKINDICDVTCPHCKFTETFKFDDLPSFFPDEWFE